MEVAPSLLRCRPDTGHGHYHGTNLASGLRDNLSQPFTLKPAAYGQSRLTPRIRDVEHPQHHAAALKPDFQRPVSGVLIEDGNQQTINCLVIPAVTVIEGVNLRHCQAEVLRFAGKKGLMTGRTEGLQNTITGCCHAAAHVIDFRTQGRAFSKIAT